jgi:hypothetical protein
MLILFLTVMLVLVGPIAPVSSLPFVETKTANVSPNPAIWGTFVTVSGSGFQPNCGPPGSGPCVFEIVFVPGGGCGLTVADQLGLGGGGMGVFGFAPSGFFIIVGGGVSFFATTDQFGTFSTSILLDNTFSATNYSIVGLDGKNTFCIDPFTIVLQLCVIQVGVEQPTGAVLWLPGYAYPETPISQCQNRTDVLGQNGLDETIVIQQFVQNRTSYTEPFTIPTPL